MGDPVLILVAVVMLAVGGYLAASLPKAIRQAVGVPVLVKTLSSMVQAGGAGALLAVGGAILAALVGAATVAIWLATAAGVAVGVVVLSVVALVTLALWRRVVVKRHSPVR